LLKLRRMQKEKLNWLEAIFIRRFKTCRRLLKEEECKIKEKFSKLEPLSLKCSLIKTKKEINLNAIPINTNSAGNNIAKLKSLKKNMKTC